MILFFFGKCCGKIQIFLQQNNENTKKMRIQGIQPPHLQHISDLKLAVGRATFFSV
jgi:hypothetical protein